MVSNAEKQRDREQSADVNKHLIHESHIFKVVQSEMTFSPEETKTYDLVSLTLEECLEKIQAREIIDAKTILGLLWINHQK